MAERARRAHVELGVERAAPTIGPCLLADGDVAAGVQLGARGEGRDRPHRVHVPAGRPDPGCAKERGRQGRQGRRSAADALHRPAQPFAQLLGAWPSGDAADPSFLLKGYVYLYYAFDDTPASPDTAAGLGTARLTRVTTVGDTAPASTEYVVLDDIPADYGEHMGGNVKFAPDGSIFLSTDDEATAATVDDAALRAQDLDSLAARCCT